MKDFRITIQPDGKLGLPEVTAADRKELYDLVSKLLGGEGSTTENEMPCINFSKVNLIR